ncbi:esterase/lipase family protein [Mariprofundus ferrooxydans]|uniref:esterase/lipase family protein n=1 Tax=Mariprofundus ferrooxydans TaxID=314344 RepID=UPI00142F4045|nr:phospholipase [Mariprofundus ferrooxydans]
MQLIFVHGWSVTNTNTYGGLPEALAKAGGTEMDLDIRHIYLGRYISFHDQVTLDDIARAMDRALRDLPGNGDTHIEPFSCITHSTGGPVLRFWVDKYYGPDAQQGLNDLPLKHLVMLAPANHGSALAKLGKARVGRIKAWFSGVEPGQRVLDWLCLGSEGQWQLNERALAYDYAAHGFYPFVLIGQGIDRSLYDFLNNYLVEPGSDGVVRVSGANMNYRYLSLTQSRDQVIRKQPRTLALNPDGDVRASKPVPLGVYNGYSHSGKKMGIMASIAGDDDQAPVVQDILACFRVESAADYLRRAAELELLTDSQQAGTDRFCMFVFNICDDQGEQIGEGDYDLYLLAGNNYQPQKLPKGFFKDSQMNSQSGRLVYYLDANRMEEIRDGKFGLRVVARPTDGFSYYCPAEFRSEGMAAAGILKPNQTTYVNIILHRFVDEAVFRFDPATAARTNFKRIKPSGRTLG